MHFPIHGVHFAYVVVVWLLRTWFKPQRGTVDLHVIMREVPILAVMTPHGTDYTKMPTLRFWQGSAFSIHLPRNQEFMIVISSRILPHQRRKNGPRSPQNVFESFPPQPDTRRGLIKFCNS